MRKVAWRKRSTHREPCFIIKWYFSQSSWLYNATCRAENCERIVYKENEKLRKRLVFDGLGLLSRFEENFVNRWRSNGGTSAFGCRRSHRGRFSKYFWGTPKSPYDDLQICQRYFEWETIMNTDPDCSVASRAEAEFCNILFRDHGIEIENASRNLGLQNRGQKKNTNIKTQAKIRTNMTSVLGSTSTYRPVLCHSR